MNLTMSSNYHANNTSIADRKPVIKVLGLGGGGSNAVNRMIELDLKGVDFIAANTDAQALAQNLAPVKIQLGANCTRGLGSGGNPHVGEEAAEESYKEIYRSLMGADMVFLTAGMGGGTGTGAISVAARAARAIGAVTVAVVTTPFSFEIGRRQKNASDGLARLRPFTDTLVTIPNDRLLKVAPRDLSLEMAFRMADDVLRQGIQGISELITETGVINVDFSHIRQVMKSGGGSLLSIGVGHGEDKAHQAIERALNHPLIESINLENASAIIANFTAGPDLTFMEVIASLNELQEKTNNQAEIIPGVINDERMGDRCQVILIITGLGATAVEMPASMMRSQPQKTVQPETQPAPIYSSQTAIRSSYEMAIPQMAEAETTEPVSVQTNLDIPAFLRRRLR